MVYTPKGVNVATDTAGVKPMSIQGRLARERERLLGMTDEERAWRKKWVKDQHLSPNEPRFVPELQRELTNPIRRLYRAPLDFLFKFTEPILGKSINQNVRYITGKLMIGTYMTIFIMYWVKYNGNDWERAKGFKLYTSRLRVLPGDPGYPAVSTRLKPQDYASRNFENSPI